MTLLYMQALQNQAIFMSRLAPVQILIQNNLEKKKCEEVIMNMEEKTNHSQKLSEKSIFEDHSPNALKQQPIQMKRFSSFARKGN